MSSKLHQLRIRFVTRNNPLFLLSAILAAAFFPFASATMAFSRHLCIVRAVGRQFQKSMTESFNFNITVGYAAHSADAKHQWTFAI
jgi:hypothetical protein